MCLEFQDIFFLNGASNEMTSVYMLLLMDYVLVFSIDGMTFILYCLYIIMYFCNTYFKDFLSVFNWCFNVRNFYYSIKRATISH